MLPFLACAACGGRAAVPDGGFSDAALSVDASSIPADASIGTIDVTVLSRDGLETPVDGAWIVADPDAGFVQTDSNGNASLTITSGVPVTAVYPPTADFYPVTSISTFLDVQVGDHLVFDGPQNLAPSTPAGAMNLAWSPDPSMQYWRILTPCGVQDVPNNGGPYAVPRYQECARSPFAAEVIGFDSTGTPVEYAIETGIEFIDGGSHLITAPFQIVGPFQVNLIGLEGVGGVRGAVAPLDPPAVLDSARFEGVPDAGTFAATLPNIPGPEGTIVYVESSVYDQAGMIGIQTRALALPSSATSVDGDDGWAPLRWLDDEFFDYDHRRITWQQTAGGDGDYLAARLSWTHNSSVFYWRLYGPPGTGTLTFPWLGGPFTDDFPTAQDITSSAVTIFDVDAFSSYDDVRGAGEPVVYNLDSIHDAATFHAYVSSSAGS
jgi:hypothetical protein